MIGWLSGISGGTWEIIIVGTVVVSVLAFTQPKG